MATVRLTQAFNVDEGSVIDGVEALTRYGVVVKVAPYHYKLFPWNVVVYVDGLLVSDMDA